jgi:hypothetical protein
MGGHKGRVSLPDSTRASAGTTQAVPQAVPPGPPTCCTCGAWPQAPHSLLPATSTSPAAARTSVWQLPQATCTALVSGCCLALLPPPAAAPAAAAAAALPATGTGCPASGAGVAAGCGCSSCTGQLAHGCWLPRPSCPLLLLPQPHTRPASVRATTWPPPAARQQRATARRPSAAAPAAALAARPASAPPTLGPAARRRNRHQPVPRRPPAGRHHHGPAAAALPCRRAGCPAVHHAAPVAQQHVKVLAARHGHEGGGARRACLWPGGAAAGSGAGWAPGSARQRALVRGRHGGGQRRAGRHLLRRGRAPGPLLQRAAAGGHGAPAVELAGGGAHEGLSARAPGVGG